MPKRKVASLEPEEEERLNLLNIRTAHNFDNIVISLYFCTQSYLSIMAGDYQISKIVFMFICAIQGA